jgi:hypothetical protein
MKLLRMLKDLYHRWRLPVIAVDRDADGDPDIKDHA